MSTILSRSLPHLLHLLIQLAICTASAQQHGKQNISLGSALSTHSPNSKWISPSGEFAFGLYPIPQNLYLLGIWFDRIPDKTLVWTANGDDPADEGSTVELTTNGDLILYDSQRNQKWFAQRNTTGEVSTAAMHDDGNFVLLDNTSKRLWQSFDSPTDTLLPGQTLQWESTMFSKASSTNYSKGRYQLSLQEDGNLVLYASVRRAETEGAYWSSSTEGSFGSSSMTLNFDKSGLLYLVNGTNATVDILTQGNAGPGQYVRRVTLDIDGILRQYVWMTNGTSHSWSPIWRVVNDPCRDVKNQCGINGICTLTDEMEPDCVCPPGFDFIDGEDHFKGCIRTSSQDCSARNIMQELVNTDWINGADYSALAPIDEATCQKVCLDDCLCVVVTYGNEICYKKRSPLIDGRRGTDITNKAFVKVSQDLQSDSNYHPPPIQRKSSRALLFTGIGLVAFSALLLACTLLIWWCGLGLRTTISPRGSEEPKAPEGLKSFRYKDIETATGGFKHQLGKGAFGTVYKGLLSDGRPVAVKKLDRILQEGEKEFTTEMQIIGTTHHKNLVQLFGFCNEGSQRLLVYEYMVNGSLDAALFEGNDFLSWDMRVKIAIGTARGIVYLHEECRTQIIHCDIKPQNILLDDTYNPKISDFGLAKLMGAEQTRTFTMARGTRGYVAPEWQRNMAITVKADVYSFGTMLLEIICCRKSVALDAPENEIVLSDWVYECLKFGRLVKLVEHQQSEDNIINVRHVERMVLAGLWCIQEDPSLRPPMKKVVQMLEGTVDIAVPPPPKSFISSL